MIEVALVAFADTWGWNCSVVLTDPTAGTVQTHPLEGTAQKCSELPSPRPHFEDFSFPECKNSELSWAQLLWLLLILHSMEDSGMEL